MATPEIAKLGHVSLVTPDLESSLWFFHDVIGLEITERSARTVYLRANMELEHHSLVLKAGDRSHVEYVAWRVKRPEDVDGFARLLTDAGVAVSTIAAGTELGIGDAIEFRLPSGHLFRMYYEVDKPLPPQAERSVLKNQVYRSWNRGVAPRRIDHANLWTGQDPAVTHEWLGSNLGFKMREYVRAGEQVIGGWMSVTPLVHDVAIMADPHAPTAARMHHIAYWLDNAQDVLRACDILREHGIVPDQGPGKHGVSQAFFTYVRDPASGHRIELFSNGYLIFDPDWQPIEWTKDEIELALTMWGPTDYVPHQDNHIMNTTTEA